MAASTFLFWKNWKDGKITDKEKINYGKPKGESGMIRKTRDEDLGQVMEIIHLAQENFRKLSIDQWQNGYPNEEIIKQDMEKGQSYVFEQEGRIDGTAVISCEREWTYDRIKGGSWVTGDEKAYLVIHRIATHDRAKRTGTAGRVLKYAEELGRELGRQSIRIDTHPDNHAMRKFLEKQGFCFCGHIYLSDGALRYAYEKEIV